MRFLNETVFLFICIKMITDNIIMKNKHTKFEKNDNLKVKKDKQSNM